MGQVMVAIQHPVPWYSQLLGNLGAHPQLVDHPRDHGLAEDLVGLGIGLQDGHQDAVKLAERLLIEDRVIHVLTLDSSTLQAELDCLVGEVEVVLDAGEALLFGGSDQLSILQQGSRSIMVVAGNSQDIHVSLGDGPVPSCSPPWGGPTT